MKDKDRTREELIKEAELLESRYRESEKLLNEAKSELEMQTWGLKKTNEAIKLLYGELEDKNKKLQHLDQMKSDFISTVSHELRTPLTITKEGINLVIDGIPGELNDKQKKVLTIARDNIDRLARIINELLDISKIEAGKIELKKTQFDICGLIEKTALSFESKAKERNLALKTAVCGAEILIYADMDKITQVLTNLIYNAIKFTKEGFIEILVNDKKDEIECVVADTGVGISEEDLPNVFSKFQQFGRIAGPGEKGTGLGLSIAKGIVELHKGRVWVESEIDKGTRFIFTLPKSTEALLLKECANTAVQKAARAGSKMSVAMVSFVDFERIRMCLPQERLDAVFKDIEALLKNNLRKDTGVCAVKGDGRFGIILADCDKQGAGEAVARIKQTLDSFLSYEKLTGEVELRLGHVTYPDDGDSGETLIKKVLEVKRGDGDGKENISGR